MLSHNDIHDYFIHICDYIRYTLSLNPLDLSIFIVVLTKIVFRGFIHVFYYASVTTIVENKQYIVRILNQTFHGPQTPSINHNDR